MTNETDEDKTAIAVAVFDKNAELYSQKYMDVSIYYDSLDLFCDLIKIQNADIIDLACGPGNVTKYLLDKRPDFKMLATDLSPKMLEIAKEHNPSATFSLLDCKDIDQLEASYDGIMCSFAFPYLSKEEVIKFLKNVTKVLKEDGVIYISTMEDNNLNSGWESGSTGDKIFINYHEESYLISNLKENNFEIIDLSRITYPGKADKMIVDLIIIAKLTMK